MKTLALTAAVLLLASGCAIENFDNGIPVKTGQRTLSNRATDAMSAMLVRNSCRKVEAANYPLPAGTPNGAFTSKRNANGTFYRTVALNGYASQYVETFHANGKTRARVELNASGLAEGWSPAYDQQGRPITRMEYRNGYPVRSQAYNAQGQLERDNRIDCAAGTITPAR
ncbi:hypothetical protein H9Q10_08155 [Eikenella sp. S3360]|uniref:MORN repeat variant n=1 Tax=Eikenella glucosivorans TaxID=2766967 RepID=A0ABS0NBF0_9NEIS|nr:hypothetical protein [Eikenella glucosivorans]MBH5329638.1 hypothetical protein [Eikenella glucosivorans]